MVRTGLEHIFNNFKRNAAVIDFRILIKFPYMRRAAQCSMLSVVHQNSQERELHWNSFITGIVKFLKTCQDCARKYFLGR